MSKQNDQRFGPIECDACIFQVASTDISSFYCQRHSPLARRDDGLAQWPMIRRGGEPQVKGCGEGRKKDSA